MNMDFFMWKRREQKFRSTSAVGMSIFPELVILLCEIEIIQFYIIKFFPQAYGHSTQIPVILASRSL